MARAALIASFGPLQEDDDDLPVSKVVKPHFNKPIRPASDGGSAEVKPLINREKLNQLVQKQRNRILSGQGR